MIKKRYIFLIMFICLFAVSAVSANEMINETDSLMIDESNDLISYGMEDENLTNNYGTFDDLTEEISNADNELKLTRNYSNIYRNSILINKTITIDGNGFVIDGNNYNQKPVFRIYSDNVILKNLKFINCSDAIVWSGDNGILTDSIFINCNVNDMHTTNDAWGASGSAVYWAGINGNLNNCTFINSSTSATSAFDYGGQGERSIISYVRGGAVCWEGPNGIINDCTFINTTSSAEYYGTNSKYNVHLESKGGAVYFHSKNGTLSNCNFINTKTTTSMPGYAQANFINSESRGGAVYLVDGNINNCNFLNCSSPSGGAAFIISNCSINDCNFLNCSGVYGGAIYSYQNNQNRNTYTNCIINNCTFLKCTSSYGGAIYENSSNAGAIVSNSYFTNCECIYQGDCIFWESDNGKVSNCTFKGNSDYEQERYVYWEGVNGTLENSKVDTLDKLYYSQYKIKISNNTKIRKIVFGVNNLNKYYGGSERFIVQVMDDENQVITNEVVKISINGQEYTKITNSNGEASMAINLNNGIYNVTTECEGFEIDSIITIESTISGNDIKKIYKNGTQYYATFKDSQGNLLKNTDVKFNINGVFYTRTTNNQGTAKMNINLNPGTYILTAENPVNGEKHSNKITVLSNIVENYDLTKYYRNDSQYRVRLLDDNGKPVGAGVDVTFNINGVFYTRTTNANGYAKMNINLGEGTYIITADYKGLKSSNTIKVLPILSADDLTMYYKDGSKFAVKLVDGQGKAYGGQSVTFNINGVFYNRITDNNGVARLNINLLPDKYIITSSFNGFNIANNVVVKPMINPSVDPSINPSDNENNKKIIYGYWDTGDPIYELNTWENFGKYEKADWPDNPNAPTYSSKYFTDNDEIIITIKNGVGMLKQGNYKIEAHTYYDKIINIDVSGKEWKYSGVDISVSNSLVSGTGAYTNIDKSFYISKFYSNLTGEWGWHDYEQGFFKALYDGHTYQYACNNFIITKVAVKIINGLSDDGYSFYPTSNYAPDYDWRGTSRETAIANNLHYIKHIIDDGDYSTYIPYDPVNGSYHL